MSLLVAVAAVPLALIVVAVLVGKVNRSSSPKATARRIIAWSVGVALVLAVAVGVLVFDSRQATPWLAPLKASVMASNSAVTNVTTKSALTSGKTLVLYVSCDPDITDSQADAVVVSIKHFLVDPANGVPLDTQENTDRGFDYSITVISVELQADTSKQLILDYQSSLYGADSGSAPATPGPQMLTMDDFVTWTVTGRGQTRTLDIVWR